MRVVHIDRKRLKQEAQLDIFQQQLRENMEALLRKKINKRYKEILKKAYR